jgi:hypothetical protein
MQRCGLQYHNQGWHHKLKNHVAHPHPNIFYLINLLKEQQASTEIKLIQYSAGGKHVPRKMICCSGSIGVEVIPDMLMTFYPILCDIVSK